MDINRQEMYKTLKDMGIEVHPHMKNAELKELWVEHIEKTQDPADVSDAVKSDENKIHEIKEGDLKALFDKIDSLESDIKRLKGSADKNRLSKYDAKNRAESIGKEVKLRTYNGKVIIGWEMVNNLVDRVNGHRVENVSIKLKYADGSHEKSLDYREFANNAQYKPMTVISESHDKRTGVEMYKLHDEETGDEYEVNSLFVN